MEELFQEASLSANQHVSGAALLKKGGSNFHPEEELRVIKTLTFEDLLVFHKSFFRSFRFETFFIGNISKEDSISISKALQETLMSMRVNTVILPKESVIEVRTVDIPSQSTWIYQKPIDKSDPGDKETNSVVCSNFQLYQETPYSRMLLYVLANYLHDPCFDTLRTNEQLGYIVSRGHFDIRSVLHYNILVQSSKRGAEYLSQRVLAFVDSMKEKVSSITEEEFQKYIESVRVKVVQKDLSILQEGGRHWSQIVSHHYEFDRREVNLQELDKLKREDFVSLYEELFYKNRKLLEIHLVSPNHAEENEALKSKRLSEDQSVKEVDSSEHFKRALPLYPDFNLLV